jgi:AcrR family transcriptional regulator
VSSEAPRRRPGRPPAEESAGRTEAIIAAARRHFGFKGFDATTLSGVAAEAGLSLAALYHYVDDKFQLYELVFRASMRDTWEAIAKHVTELDPSPKLADRIQGLLAATPSGQRNLDMNAFLAAAPIEFRRHPELAHLGEERDRVRLDVLRSVIEPVFLDGAFARFANLEQATRALEVLFSGWAMESFFQPEQREKLSRALMEIACAIDGEPAATSRSSSKRTTKRSRQTSA